MKKLISALLSAVICISSLGVATAHAEDELAALRAENARLQEELEAASELLTYFLIELDQISTGDINGDGYTDAVDASLILGYYAYISTNGNLTLRSYVSRRR